MSLRIYKCYLDYTVILGSASGMLRHVQALFKSLLTHIQSFLCPWHIQIPDIFLSQSIFRYIHNTILNIFTKAQSWTFDSNLNAPLFYRCYLTSRVILHIFNVIFQNYSGLFIFETYSAIFSPAKAC